MADDKRKNRHFISPQKPLSFIHSKDFKIQIGLSYSWSGTDLTQRGEAGETTVSLACVIVIHN
jgi:hypothetical protein